MEFAEFSPNSSTSVSPFSTTTPFSPSPSVQQFSPSFYTTYSPYPSSSSSSSSFPTSSTLLNKFKSYNQRKNNSQFSICKKSDCNNRIIIDNNKNMNYCSMMCQLNDWSQPTSTLIDQSCNNNDNNVLGDENRLNSRLNNNRLNSLTIQNGNVTTNLGSSRITKRQSTKQQKRAKIKSVLNSFIHSSSTTNTSSNNFVSTSPFPDTCNLEPSSSSENFSSEQFDSLDYSNDFKPYTTEDQNLFTTTNNQISNQHQQQQQQHHHHHQQHQHQQQQVEQTSLNCDNNNDNTVENISSYSNYSDFVINNNNNNNDYCNNVYFGDLCNLSDYNNVKPEYNVTEYNENDLYINNDRIGESSIYYPQQQPQQSPQQPLQQQPPQQPLQQPQQPQQPPQQPPQQSLQQPQQPPQQQHSQPSQPSQLSQPSQPSQLSQSSQLTQPSQPSQLPQQPQLSQLPQQQSQQLNFNQPPELVMMTRCSVCTLLCYSRSGICELCQSQLSSQGFSSYTNDDNINYYDYNIQPLPIHSQAQVQLQAQPQLQAQVQAQIQLHAQVQAARAAQFQAQVARAQAMQVRAAQIQAAKARVTQVRASRVQAAQARVALAQMQAARTQSLATRAQVQQQLQSMYNYYISPTSISIPVPDTSENKTKLSKTQLIVLTLHHEEFVQIQKYFLKGLPHARIHSIIKLQMPTKLIENHEQYKKTILNSSSFYHSNMVTNNLSSNNVANHLVNSMEGNMTNNNLDKFTNRMFHGTKISCNPQRFINGQSSFCMFNCGMCGIIQNGNQGKYSRFNGRMWFANNSAISLGYCGLSTSRTIFNCTPFSSKNSLMAMFIVDVVSIHSGDIIIVDKDAATLPKYLILFETGF